MAKKNKRKQMILHQRIGKVFSLLLVIVTVIFFGMIFSMNILPIKYMTILLGIYAPIVIILVLLMLMKKLKLKIKIPCEIISVILVFILFLGISYLNKTMNFIGKIKDKKYQTENYYVVVLENSQYQDLNSLKNKTIGIHTSTLDSQEDAFNDFNKKLSYNGKDYTDFMKLGNDLINKNIDAMFINGSYLSILQDEDETFGSKMKILEIIEIKIKNETIKKDIDVTKEPFNLYISGIDIYGNITSVSRSDVNIIVTVNPVTHQILLTSIPRDYYVRLHGTTGYRDKLTHAGIYGVDMSISTLEDLLDIDINYYARVNFTTLIKLVDAIGGVDVYSDYTFTSHHGNFKFNVGMNHMNGEQALGFTRERYAFKDGDRQRGKNQQKVITAIINKALSSKTLITKYTNILDSLQSSFQTNLGSNKIYSLVNMQLDKMPSWEITSISLDGTGKSEYTYSYSGGKLYVMEPDLSTVEDAKEKIKEIMNIQ